MCYPTGITVRQEGGKVKIRSPFLSGFLSILFIVLPMGSVHADELPEARKDGTLQFRGKILEPENVSGIDHRGKFLVIGADEGGKIQVLERVDKGVYQAHSSREISLKLKKKKFKLKNREVDIEGIAWGNDYVYKYPGDRNTNSFDIYSPGPDGIGNNADDIGNWSAGKPQQ